MGAAINVPLPPGSGEGAYAAATRMVVAPALDDFQPELILFACGFDAGTYDPLGRQMLTAGGFRALTEAVTDAAARWCDGRLVISHEGGYSASYVPFCGLAVLETLSGVRTGIEDPLSPRLVGIGGQHLQPHQEEAIREAAEVAPLASP